MSILDKPVGVVVIHYHFPGFLDLYPNTIYIIESADLYGAIVFVEHVRPLVVTDFRNELIERKLPDGKSYVDIKTPIPEVSIDSVSVNGRGFEGRSGPVVAVEMDPAGRVFCQDVYSTLRVMWEVEDFKAAQSMGAYLPLLNRFIATYCFLNNDPRLRISGAIPEESNPTRIGYFAYSGSQKAKPFHERIAEVQVQEWQMHIAGMGRGSRALRDHNGDLEQAKVRATHLGSYLYNGIAPSENLIELHRLASLAFVDDRPKAAIIEVMSMLELAIISQHRALLPKDYAQLKPDKLTWKFLVNAILPSLLGLYDGDKGSMIKKANEALEVRHKVVHRGYAPTKDDANVVLSFVRHILCIFEMPEAVKGDWKRKR